MDSDKLLKKLLASILFEKAIPYSVMLDDRIKIISALFSSYAILTKKTAKNTKKEE